MRRFILKYFSAGVSRISLAVAFAVGLLTITTNAFAANTPIAGGSGGTSYSLSCGTNRALVGIRGRAGSWLDRVQGVCAQINYDGTWQGTATTTGTAGGNGGTSYELTCANGRAVTEIAGRAGSYIDQLRVRCGALGQNGRFTNLGNYLTSSAGSGGGSDFGPLSCGSLSLEPARSIRGRAGTWVDAIGLGCEFVNTLMVWGVQVGLTVPGAAGDETRMGRSPSATVTMSLTPAATATVSLTSSNTSVATVAPTTAVGTNTTQGSASITPRSPGCTTLTASYRGSSATRDLLIHSATSPTLSLTTRERITVGREYPMTVTIPSPAPSGGTSIMLTRSGDNTVGVPNSVVIPQGAVSIGFTVRPYATGCTLITASGNGGQVTNALRAATQ